MSQFKHLFTPIKIGPVTVRNRIFSVHSTGFAEPIPGEPEVMLPSERHAYFYRERAKGGLGLIIAEASHVHPSSDYLFQSHLYDPRGIPMLRKSAESVHEFGGKIFMQLQHAGHHTHNHRSMLPALSSSQSPDVASHSIPKEMEIEDIKEVQNAFAISANNAKEAGFDGFELHGTHSYLIEQFLSPFYNKRQDEYGGSTENRMRFVVELLERIRQKIGYDVALGIRMDIDEMLPGGLKIDETQILARKLEDTRLIDFLDVDVGTYHTLPFMIAPMNMPPLHQVDFIAEIKKVVKKIPVLGCPGRLTDPRDAERLLSEGHMDMVGGARVHIADPEWANKAFNGRLDDIIKCIACNWCLTRLFANANAGIACSINPVTGHEKQWGAGTLQPTNKPKRVLVVGAGPAGMELARVAALRGHKVTLSERQKELGGHLLLMAMLPGRDAYSQTIQWYERMLQETAVEVNLGHDVDANQVFKKTPDVTVLATGSTWTRKGISGFIPEAIPGWDLPNVVTPEQVIRREVQVGGTVLILDDEGSTVSAGVAELIAEQAKTVEIVTRWQSVEAGLFENMQFGVVYPKFFKRRVKFSTNTYVKKIERENVTLFNIFTNEERIQQYDNIVMITARQSDVALYKQLKGKVNDLHAIGDCVAPRSLGYITYEAHKLARTL